MADLKDVAQRANVSISTVSRVINHPHMVNDETRLRVERALRKLDYQPNRVARRLQSKSGPSQIIGLIIPDIENPFYSSIVRGVESIAYAQNYAVILCDSSENPEHESLYLKTLRGESVDGIILPPMPGEKHLPFDPVEASLPVVYFDRHWSDQVDAVVTDNRQSARAAVEHLIQLGHRRIGTICGPLSLSSTSDRLDGYRDALTAHGLSIDDDYIRSCSLDPAMARQIAEELFDLPSPPTALLTGNNQMSLGTLKAVRRRGMRVPDDIALVGFDDPAWAEIIDPPLTAIRQPRYEMGRRAAEMLFKRIEEPDRPPAVITLQSSLVVRASCGASHRNSSTHR